MGTVKSIQNYRSCHAIILTALRTEYQAVREHLFDIQEEVHQRGTIYERGGFLCSDRLLSIAIAEIGAGNTGAALECERAINHFNPNLALFIGVAGGIKDVAIGDVVVATKIYGYESGKARSTFQPRPDVGNSTYSLVQRALSESKKTDWLKRLRSVVPNPAPRVFVQPIAAGEKVIVSRRSAIFQFLRSNYDDALAVEMEGRGFLDAAHANKQVDALVIRGISDLINHKQQKSDDIFQHMASRHASAFAFELLAKLDLYNTTGGALTMQQGSSDIGAGKLQILLTATINAADQSLARAMEEHLRKISNDASLTIVEIQQGSIILILDGSREGLNKIEFLYRTGQFTELLGFKVQKVERVSESSNMTVTDVRYHNQPEAFSRVLIDQALRESGWDLQDPRQVNFEVTAGTGRADYILKNPLGKALCVLEAKRVDSDPYDAKEQARGYAENLNAPFIMLSNGGEHWFWNYERSDQRDAYRIERLPSPEDLERQRLKNLQPPRPLKTDIIDTDYLLRFRNDLKLRRYQINAIDEISNQYDHDDKRKFLLEMATGTGKTLLCATLIRRFLSTRNAERVLFIVDRIELAKQTMEDFNVILREFNPVIFKTARRTGDLLGSSVVVATIQSLLVDRRYRAEFTPFYFDLVINDEAHRSIYGDSREVVQFFQATRIGLTATPKAYLRNVNIEQLSTENPKALEARQLRDTYHYFGCEPGLPTYRYDILDAVQDPEGPFLCMPKIFDIRSEITTKALEEKGWTVTVNEQEENYKIQDLERKIFTPERNRVMCESFLKNAQRDPLNEIGRSIIFAVNQEHATHLTKILNEMKPNLAVTITSRIRDASSIAKDFRDGKRPERVAVSVDMLSTGYNCPDLLNVVLMRPIFSPTEYIQIKGRGTRLHTFRIGHTEYKKEFFFLLDYCGVAEYFEEKYDYSVPLELPTSRSKATSGAGSRSGGETNGLAEEDNPQVPENGNNGNLRIPIWTGRDMIITEEVHIVGPHGEKVDVMTFRGSFERDLHDFAAHDAEFRRAVENEDDDVVETIMNERFYHQPSMFYSPDKLVVSYGIPAPTPTFVYGALGKKSLPTRDQIITDTVASIASRFNLRYSEQQWLSLTASLIADDPIALRRFLDEDWQMFEASQFRSIGGLQALVNFTDREAVFEALRQSTLVQQTKLAALSL